MKRLACYTAPTLDNLLSFAASFDAGVLELDSYEANELLDWLLVEAHKKLGLNSELRLGSASVEKDSSGNVNVHLKNLGLSLQLPCIPDRRTA